MSASRVIAPATSATRERRFARKRARPPTACMAWVPLRRARPSFALQIYRTQSRPVQSIRTRHSLAFVKGLTFPEQRERKMRQRRQIAARADRALFGNDRADPVFSIATRSSMTSRRIPLKPRVRTLARSNIMARTSGSARGRPTPQEWLRTRFTWQLLQLFGRNLNVSQLSKAGRTP